MEQISMNLYNNNKFFLCVSSIFKLNTDLLSIIKLDKKDKVLIKELSGFYELH